MCRVAQRESGVARLHSQPESEKAPHLQPLNSFPGVPETPAGISHPRTRMAGSLWPNLRASAPVPQVARSGKCHPNTLAHEGNLTPIRRPGRKPIGSGISSKTQHRLFSHHLYVYILVISLFTRPRERQLFAIGRERRHNFKTGQCSQGNYPRRGKHRRRGPTTGRRRQSPGNKPPLNRAFCTTGRRRRFAAVVPAVTQLPRVQASEPLLRAR